MDDCKAEPVDCEGFESKPEKAGVYFNRTFTLNKQSYCTVLVNAESFVARVVFDNTSFLGVEEEDYTIGEPLLVESGQKVITIYNGASTAGSGSVTFIISFSGAYSAFSSIAAAATAIALVNLF